ncbi:MAG TPA: J domain-containing protein [Caulobacterales bacterium]|nr:J domain-containing protein [Caulobacterales bacterium]
MIYGVLIALVIAFLVLAPVRVAGARRVKLMRFLKRYGAAAALAAIALVLVLRGLEWPGLLMGVLAFVVWRWPLDEESDRLRHARPNMADAEARAVLGVGPEATAADIRAAFRSKMRTAHPDRGGGHDAAAQLVSARDRLLRRT